MNAGAAVAGAERVLVGFDSDALFHVAEARAATPRPHRVHTASTPRLHRGRTAPPICGGSACLPPRFPSVGVHAIERSKRAENVRARALVVAARWVAQHAALGMHARACI